MDKTVYKSALLAALIYAAAYLIFDVYKAFMHFPYTSSVDYNDLTIAGVILVVPPFLLGFVSVYFFKRNKGEPSLANFHDLGLLAVLFSLLFLSLPEAFFANYVSYDWGLPQVIGISYGDYVHSLEVGEVLFVAFELFFIKISISILPSLLGVTIGSLLLFEKTERMSWKKKKWSGYMICTLVLLFFSSRLLLCVLFPAPYSGSSADGATGFHQVVPVDWRADKSGLLSITLINDAGKKIRVGNIYATTFDKDCSMSVINKDLRAGEVISTTLNGCSFPSVGEFYRANIRITYKNLESGVEYNSTGECHGTIGG